MPALILKAYEDAASGGVLVIGTDRRILSRNRRFLDMWRLPEASAAEGAFWALLSGMGGLVSDPAVVLDRLRDPRAFCDEAGRLDGQVFRLIDGRTLEIAGRSLCGTADEAIGWVWYFRELEREARLAAALRKASASERKAIRNEARLRDAIETIPGGFVLFDAEERFVVCNEAYRAMWPGAAHLLVPGTPFVEILHGLWDAGFRGGPSNREDWIADRLERFRNPGGAYEQRRSNGGWLLVDERITAEGGVAGIRVDITDLKRREAQLQALNDALAQREAQLRHLCGNIPGIVLQMRVQVDGSVAVPFISDHVEDLCGLSPAAVMADPMRLFRAIHREDRQALTAASRTASREAAPWRSSFRVVHAESGAVTWLRGGFVPTPSPDGSILWDGVMVDVTLLKAHEEELSRAIDRAELANRAKTEFLANMSHELRTPLNAIIGFSEIMLSELFGPLGQQRYVDYARDMHASGQHLLAIINALLDVAKIEAGQMELDERAMSVRALVEDCLPFVREKATERGIELAVAVPDDLPRLSLDPVRMRQVLLNVLSNAVKFTEPGGTIAVAADRTAGGGLALRVADTGIGMTAEEVAVALQPFRQVDRALSRRYEGTGLGLPLAQRLAELHGGRLEIDSVPGEGTRVTILIPPERVLG
ncbi:PAS domain-containing sensor histidine kinase [Aliidongia dinghuensis]|uniref:PAS domain-containing sensor histidine kinase n=1 Tax=Aliidongia dinghuensis TaxID=1867774 RepID=UPI00166E663A|nr:PAS domain-containing sensor histidine kinase [Aliidongia dinghuensis]